MTPELVARLQERYGLNPQDVGAASEDDFGDLLHDAWLGLGHPEDQFDETWRLFEEVASASRATTFPAWLAELVEAVG